MRAVIPVPLEVNDYDELVVSYLPNPTSAPYKAY